MDNSGKGKLYVGKFDGRLHLYGAEWGCWRIDQNANYYQGWDRMWMGMDRQPGKFGTVKYTDKDDNGFFDYIEYDLDGDKKFEMTIDLKALGLDDRCELIDISTFKYKDYTSMMKKMSKSMWKNAMTAVQVAHKYNVQTLWYAKLMQALSVRQQYNNGYWLQFYIYKDLEHTFMQKGDQEKLKQLTVAYYSGNWKSMLK